MKNGKLYFDGEKRKMLEKKYVNICDNAPPYTHTNTEVYISEKKKAITVGKKRKKKERRINNAVDEILTV